MLQEAQQDRADNKYDGNTQWVHYYYNSGKVYYNFIINLLHVISQRRPARKKHPWEVRPRQRPSADPGRYSIHHVAANLENVPGIKMKGATE